jgi:hypothetical protein
VALAQTDVSGFFGDTDFSGTTGLGDEDLPTTIAILIKTAMSFLGIVAVVIILIGGFMWMTAAGNDDRVKKAKQILGAGVIGLVIIMAAYAIAAFVLGQLTTATNTIPPTD